jgi:hypothetical protein
LQEELGNCTNMEIKYMLLNNQWANGKIKRELKNFLREMKIEI